MGRCIKLEPGADLVLLHPDGSEEVLVDTTDGAVTDPFVSFDGQWVYYSFFPNVQPSGLNTQRGNLPYAGAAAGRPGTATGDGTCTIALAVPVKDAFQAWLYAQVAGNQGNITRAAVKFSVHSQQLFCP